MNWFEKSTKRMIQHRLALSDESAAGAVSGTAFVCFDCG